MQILHTISDCTNWSKKHHQSLGFIPTMGALHKGHLTLIQKSKELCKQTIVSIYINPTQFSGNEDLLSYPKTVSKDLEKLEGLNVDAVFLPNDKDMYPEKNIEFNYKNNLFSKLEGISRPHFFFGVTKIVSSLFKIIHPTHAFFGEKDAQQSRIIKKMIIDLNYNIKFVSCPTLRDANGLALSSRNNYLNTQNKKSASLLYQSLQIVKNAIINGENDVDKLKNMFLESIKKNSDFKVDYISMACNGSLDELTVIVDSALISAAVFFKNVRLIDNFTYQSST